MKVKKTYPSWVLSKDIYITMDRYNIIVMKKISKKSKNNKNYSSFEPIGFTSSFNDIVNIVNKHLHKKEKINEKKLSEISSLKTHFHKGKLILDN